MPLTNIGNYTFPVLESGQISYLGENEPQYPGDDVILSRTKLELNQTMSKHFLHDLFYEVPSKLVQSMRSFNMEWNEPQLYSSSSLFINWFNTEDGRTHYRLLGNVVNDINGDKIATFHEMQPNKDLVIRNTGPTKISEGETVYILPPFLPIFRGAENSYPLFTVNNNSQKHYALPMILSEKVFIEIGDDIDRILVKPSATARTALVKTIMKFDTQFKDDGITPLSILKLCMLKKGSAGTVVRSFHTRFMKNGNHDIEVNEPFMLRVNSSFATK